MTDVKTGRAVHAALLNKAAAARENGAGRGIITLSLRNRALGYLCIC
jgi:hypothetical protein